MRSSTIRMCAGFTSARSSAFNFGIALVVKDLVTNFADCGVAGFSRPSSGVHQVWTRLSRESDPNFRELLCLT